MSKLLSRASLVAVFAGIVTLALSVTASAHVTVKPAEVVTAGFRTFTISVPNEKEISTTTVKLVVPDELKYVQPTQKVGWSIAIDAEGSGENAEVKSITWSGNEVKAGFRDEFTFSGQVPGTATELQWKAYQTYSDGTVVAWDKASSGEGHDTEDKNSGPFSVTKVVKETTDEAASINTENASNDAKRTANTALYVSVAGVVVALVGVYLGSRKK